jgi:hypothetical protein
MKNKIDYKRNLKLIGIFLLTWIGERILDNSGLFEKILSLLKESKPNKLTYFIGQTISFSYLELLIIFLLFAISYLFINFLLKILKKSSQNTKKEKFKKRFQYMTIPENETVTFKTEIEFDTHKNEILLDSISVYCNKHDIRYQLVLQSKNEMYECPKFPCKTSFIKQFIISKVKPLLKAELENEWNKIK